MSRMVLPAPVHPYKCQEISSVVLARDPIIIPGPQVWGGAKEVLMNCACHMLDSLNTLSENNLSQQPLLSSVPSPNALFVMSGLSTVVGNLFPRKPIPEAYAREVGIMNVES